MYSYFEVTFFTKSKQKKRQPSDKDHDQICKLPVIKKKRLLMQF